VSGAIVTGENEVTEKPIMPPVLTDTYGKRSVPDAAKFGVGTSTKEGAQHAQDARRERRPGDYSRTRE
jgi:hypothetical protein